MGNFETIDLLIIGGYLVFALSMGPIFYRFAKGSTTDFFLSARSLPWYVSGTSMVATTFGAGTPLLVTGFIWQQGIFKNWWWWSFALSNVMTVVFFARLWRRAKVTTDTEFSELRYGGEPGAWLRGFRSIYFGGIYNTYIVAWLMFGAFGIAATLLGQDPTEVTNTKTWGVIFGIVALVTIYSSMAGLWGVVTTDLVQFAIAMVSCVILAYFVVGEVGGIAALKAKVALAHPLGEGALDFFPSLSLSSIPWIMIGVFFMFQWWCSYYPGSEPGGGAYVAQRMLASKTEKHSQLATLWFTIAHYAVRPWPWILVALAGLVLYPERLAITGPEAGRMQELTYVQTVVDFLPAGWMGAMVAFLCAAFMSTVDTHLNWGASYLVRDMYARFIRPGKSPTHYVVVSRLVMIGTAVLSALVAMYVIKSLTDANFWLVGTLAGIGLVFVARFYWWRVNAWSEISAMAGAVVVNIPLAKVLGPSAWFARMVPNGEDRQAILLVIGTLLVNAIWITVTLMTKPESKETLHRFYKRVQPPGPGWRTVAKECGMPYEPVDWRDFAAFVGGVMLTWGAIYFVGKLIFGDLNASAISLVITVIGGLLLWQFLIRKADREDVLEGEHDAAEDEMARAK